MLFSSFGKLSLSFLMVASFFCAASADAKVLTDSEYDYPVINRYKSTLVGANLKPYLNRKYYVLTAKQKKEILNRSTGNPIEFRYFPGKRNAPLIFLHSGLVSNHDGDLANYLSEVLNARGYKVVLLPSPMFPGIVPDMHRSGYSGYIDQDAIDEYAYMQEVAKVLKSKGVTWDKIFQIGYSMAGINGVFIAKLDAEQQKLKFSKTIIINGPVDIAYGIDQIDSWQEVRDDMSFPEQVITLLKALKTAVNFESKTYKKYTYNYFKEWSRNISLNEEQIKLAISYHYKSSYHELTDQAETNSHRFAREECYQFSHSRKYMDYVKDALVPYAYKLTSDTGCRFDQRDQLARTLTKRYDLYNLADFLRNQKNLYMMHNADDFLLKPTDVDFLESTMGDRLVVYPRGGHYANIWHPTNQQRVFDLIDKD